MVGNEKGADTEEQGVSESLAHANTVNLIDNFRGELFFSAFSGGKIKTNITSVKSGDKSADSSNEIHGAVLTGKISGEKDKLKTSG